MPLQVRAHKVVLSSSSSFFRQFLRDHTQPNPWLFLRGVEAKLLDWLMDFIYLGEVMVTQESFPSFLALARDLGVRGLTGATPAIGKKQEKQEKQQQQQEEATAAPSNNVPSSGYTTQSAFSSQSSGYASQSGYTDVAKDGTVEYLAGELAGDIIPRILGMAFHHFFLQMLSRLNPRKRRLQGCLILISWRIPTTERSSSPRTRTSTP